MSIRLMHLSLALALVAGTLAAQAVEPAPPSEIEVVFALDTTGSMSGLIKAAKEKIWSIANMLATAKPAPRIKMGLVAYRDRGDAYVTKRTALTADLDGIYKELMSFRADGGGDGLESVNQALHEAVTKMAWSRNPHTYRVVFLVGDWGPHMDYKDDVKYHVTCKAAAESGININTILCGDEPSTVPVWKEIATLAHSEYFQVAQSGGTTQTPPTAYDTQLVALSMDLDGTRIYYGTPQERLTGEERARTAARIYASTPTSALADRAGYMASAKPGVDAGVRDLVSDVEKGKVQVKDVDERLLPDYLRQMCLEEREEYVARLLAMRKEVQTELSSLAARRQAYLMEQLRKLGKGKGGVDFVIFLAIKEQAGKMGIAY